MSHGDCWDGIESGEAEISQLHLLVFIHQDVLGLDVPVNYAARVQILGGTQQIVHDFLPSVNRGATGSLPRNRS